MIRRKTSNYTQNQEALHQASFTAMKGIDCSKSPTSEDTVLLSKNLDVDYDGGLILRKPLKYSETYADTCIYASYAYDKDIVLEFHNNGQFFKPKKDGEALSYAFKCTDIYGNTYTANIYSNADVFRALELLKTTNTPTSTLIYGISVDLKALEDSFNTVLGKTIKLYNTQTQPQYTRRLFKFYENEYSNYVLEMLTPEIATITNSEIAADFNTISDNTLALRDNYRATHTDISGILAYRTTSDNLNTVDKLTEQSGIPIIDTLNVDSTSYVVLKAFLNKPNVYKQGDPVTVENASIAIKWSSSYDGFNWTPEESSYWANKIKIASVSDELSSDLESEKNLVWKTENYYVLRLPAYEYLGLETYQALGEDTPKDHIYGTRYRVDCLTLPPDYPDRASKMYKCTLVKLKDKPSDTGSSEQLAEADKQLDFVISEIVFNFKKGTFQSVTNDFVNPLKGNFLYWNHAIYSFGESLDTNIYVSKSNSAEFPISRIIDLGTYQKNPVRKVIPWRNYLLAFTDNSVSLIQEQDVGFTTKTVNNSIGTSLQDANTCVSILNGVIFKSGSKIYSLAPNYSSGDETILNIAEISKPVNHILESVVYNDTYRPFAFTTSEDYYLFIPGDNLTTCLKYDYSRKIWSYYEYNVVIFKHELLSVSDIKLFAKVGNRIVEYAFNKESVSDEPLTYGDVLSDDKKGNVIITPIDFSLDSGQKTDNISLTKQFVESKIIVATLGDKDNFSMDVRVDIEGNTFKKHIDLNTDGALLRSSADEVLTLGSNTEFNEHQDTSNVMRQMFLRYAGKGKTIRHIISGQSLYKFKIYETFYRYKILNIKQ